MRLWVEILKKALHTTAFPSASSWGCELKYGIMPTIQKYNSSASSWGCELKSLWNILRVNNCIRQPLREAVSWNNPCSTISAVQSSQPLREAVSWNVEQKVLTQDGKLSASSWGCELKCQGRRYPLLYSRQPLREAVSWNFDRSHNAQNVTCQPLREAVSWNIV